ncbi:hypothetical protein MY11210_007610 [Beauveria gryllotalpidicola]
MATTPSDQEDVDYAWNRLLSDWRIPPELERVLDVAERIERIEVVPAVPTSVKQSHALTATACFLEEQKALERAFENALSMMNIGVIMFGSGKSSSNDQEYSTVVRRGEYLMIEEREDGEETVEVVSMLPELLDFSGAFDNYEILDLRVARMIINHIFDGGRVMAARQALPFIYVKQRVHVTDGPVSTEFILGMPFIRSARVTFKYPVDQEGMELWAQFGNTRVMTPVAGPIAWESAEKFLDQDISLQTQTLALDPELVKQEELLRGVVEEGDVVFRLGEGDKEEVERSLRQHASGVEELKVFTLYKRKGVKVEPLDISDGSVPEGDPYWRAKKWKTVEGSVEPVKGYADFLTGKFSKLEKGTRLHGDRLRSIEEQIGDLTERERDMFLTMLYNREAALAWTFEESGSLDLSIAPP